MPLLGIVALIGVGGWAIGKVGEGVDAGSNGVLKLAIAGSVGFIVAKKLKVI